MKERTTKRIVARQCRRPFSVISIFCHLGKGAIRMAVALSLLIAYSIICEFRAFDFLLIEFRSGAKHVSNFESVPAYGIFKATFALLYD